MRKLLTWLLVTLGIAALVRRLRQRSTNVAPAEEAPPAGDPARELRRKLAESRSEDEPVETPGAAEGSVDERRAEVHEEGRAALEEMRSTPDDA
ncbi:MAG TPA: hypothetical protein VK926_08360 [Gaiellaceae bacterium]|nr:hypothetical protein [Gaiellaceae bacterium]